MYIDVPLVNGCFALSLPASQKMVLLAMAVKSYKGEYEYSNTLLEYSGCSRNTLDRAMQGLRNAGVVLRPTRGVYRLSVAKQQTHWVNVEHFSTCMEMSLPYNEKILLLAIVKHVSQKTGNCYPKVETLSRLAGISARSVRRIQKELAHRGMLCREKQGRYWGYTPQYDLLEPPNMTIVPPNMTGLTPNMTASNKYKKAEEGVGKKGAAPPASTTFAGKDTMRKPFVSKIHKMSAKDVVKKVQEKKSVTNTRKGMQVVWRTGNAKYFDNPMAVSHLTKKDRGNLDHIFKMGVEHEFDQTDALKKVLDQWSVFVSYVMSQDGLNTAPNAPSLGWLTMYAHRLYQWYTQALDNDNLQLTAKPVNPKNSNDAGPKDKDWSVEELKKKFKLGDYADD